MDRPHDDAPPAEPALPVDGELPTDGALPSAGDAGPALDPDEPTAVWRVTLSGPVDLASAEQVERTLTEAVEQGGRYLLVDVGDVEFMDSTGLRAILAGRAAVEAAGGALVLERCSPAVRQLLELTALLTGLTTGPEPPA